VRVEKIFGLIGAVTTILELVRWMLSAKQKEKSGLQNSSKWERLK
jgi:hypothetical protein